MKKLTTQQVRDLLNQVYREEISFSRMVEIMNEMVSESEVSEFKDGDFVAGLGCVFILHKQIDEYSAQYHVLLEIAYTKTNGILHYHRTYSPLSDIFKLRLADEAVKQELLDALAKEGKRWNEEKKCVEDIPVRKFQKGDRVRIKEGVSSRTVHGQYPVFQPSMDDFIGTTMTVNRYEDIHGFVICNESDWRFNEDWLEPYTDEPKKGDLAIFWDDSEEYATIRFYDQPVKDYTPLQHKDNIGFRWKNAIKFESKEQFERLIKGEI